MEQFAKQMGLMPSVSQCIKDAEGAAESIKKTYSTSKKPVCQTAKREEP